MTSLLMSSPPIQHFAQTFSMQIFQFQRRSCKISFLFPPRRQCAGGRRQLLLFMLGGDGENEVIPWKYTNSFPIKAPWLSPQTKATRETPSATKWSSTNFWKQRVHHLYGSVNFKRAHPPTGICHLVGPDVGNLSDSLCPGVGHLSVLLEALKVIPFSIFHLQICLFKQLQLCH